jgi:hypothetical protein
MSALRFHVRIVAVCVLPACMCACVVVRVAFHLAGVVTQVGHPGSAPAANDFAFPATPGYGGTAEPVATFQAHTAEVPLRKRKPVPAVRSR